MKLEELKVGMKVWHPTFGKGKVPKIDSDMEECTVFFEDMVIYPAPVFEDSNPKGDPFSIGNLYPHPVTVIPKGRLFVMESLLQTQALLIRELKGQIDPDSPLKEKAQNDPEYIEFLNKTIKGYQSALANRSETNE